MTAHPFQPGTVWAPKNGVGRVRHVVWVNPVHNGAEIWYVTPLKNGRMSARKQCWITTMQDWAGDRIEP